MPGVSINAVVGDNTLVAGLPGRRIAVVSYMLVGAEAVGTFTVQWKSGTVPLSGPMVMVDGAPLALAAGLGMALLLTNIGEALILTRVGGASVRGHLWYVQAGEVS